MLDMFLCLHEISYTKCILHKGLMHSFYHELKRGNYGNFGGENVECRILQELYEIVCVQMAS